MRTEFLLPSTAEAYRTTFAPADPVVRAELPPGWEGILFPFTAAFADLRPDGSPARDGILPEFDLPRRMYAGEDTVYHLPLRVGEEIGQVARAGTVVEKSGRSGRLVFADIVREYSIGGALAIESTWHDVFLDAAPRGAAAPTVQAPTVQAPTGTPDWSEDAQLDSRQLFRFSALTFNTHRIHYDRAWARDVEGLDDLLVHGPLTRILLLDAARRHAPGAVADFSFRALAPVLVDRRFRIEGRAIDAGTEVLAVDDQRGVLARGQVGWR